MFFRTLILACLIASANSGIWNLINMKECTGGKSLFYYNGYGCNCGLWRSYNLPVDDVDICCVRHRGCYYAALESKDCKSKFLLYFIPYEWKCVDHNPVCSEKANISKNICASAICQCDSEFVKCLNETDLPEVEPTCPYRNQA